MLFKNKEKLLGCGDSSVSKFLAPQVKFDGTRSQFQDWGGGADQTLKSRSKPAKLAKPNEKLALKAKTGPKEGHSRLPSAHLY